MWQFSEAVRGLADGCQQLGTPVTGGNVSFYNQTGTTAILPTPVDRRARRARRRHAARAVRASAPTAHGSTCSARPATSSAARSGCTSCTATSAVRRRRSTSSTSSGWPALLAAGAAAGVLDSAHDLSEGGLAQALVESCLRHGVGAQVTLPEGARPVRRPVQRVDGPGARLGHAGARRRLARAGRRARRAGHARWAPPTCSSPSWRWRGSSASRCASCAPRGRRTLPAAVGG